MAAFPCLRNRSLKLSEQLQSICLCILFCITIAVSNCFRFFSNKCPFRSYKGVSLETFQVAQQTCVALFCSEQRIVKGQCLLCSLLAHSSRFIKKQSSFCTYLNTSGVFWGNRSLLVYKVNCSVKQRKSTVKETNYATGLWFCSVLY